LRDRINLGARDEAFVRLADFMGEQFPAVRGTRARQMADFT
jgi:hypothetical protein